MTARAHRGMVVIAGALLFLAGLASFVYLRPVPRPLLCAGDEVSAYGSVGTFYIPGYHPPPDLGSPSACLGGVRQALAAGLHPAPPPSGGTLVGDAFYLVPAGQGLRQGCMRAATLLHFAVPCPELIPMHWEPVTCPADTLGCAVPGHGPERLDTFQLMQGDMIVPDTFMGNGKKTLYGRGNLIVTAGPLGNPIWNHWNTCADPRGSDRSGPSLGGRSSTWVTCPTELDFTAHTLLRWSGDEGVNYTVGLDGTQAITRQVVQVVAEHLRYVAA